ncbi:MAG: tetratricopeptide repeat protein [Saprospiraceae bacterium]|nr:tetratricopeptide repeat protein [Saprospiraceae bacterium]
MPHVVFCQSSSIDTLKQQFVLADHDTSRVRALYLLTYEFFQSSLDSALFYARQNLTYAQDDAYPKFKCSALSAMGATHMYLNNFDSAKYYFEEAIKITKTHDLPNQSSALYTNMGVLYKRHGQYDEAIQSYIDGLIEDERNGHLYGMTIKKLNISNLYGLQGDNVKALQYGEEALVTCRELTHQDKAMIEGLLLNNIGTIYIEELDFPRAKEKFNEALVVNTSAGNQNEIARNLHNIGALYEKVDSAQTGIPMLIRALEIRTEVGDQIGLVETYMQLGSSYGKTGNTDSSDYNFNRAIETAKSINNHALISETYLAISNNDVVAGNYEQALDHFRLSVSYQDSLEENYDREAYLEMETKYRAAQKDAQIAQQDLLINKRTSQRNQYLIGILGLLFLSAFIYYRSRQKRKLADEKIKNLEQEQKLLAIDYMVQGQEEERKRIARDLHDGLGGLLSSASMQMQSIQKEIDKLSEMQLFSKAEQMIDNACKEVRRIAHDMMPSALIDLGLIDAIDDLASQIRSKGSLQVEVTTSSDSLDITDVQAVNLYRIVQEFCNNTIKHAAASHIGIVINQDKGFLHLELTDDGVGYDISDANLNRGIGLNSIESRIKYLGGSLQDLTAVGTGCRYIIKIPLRK